MIELSSKPDPKKLNIGLSFSRCVADILAGLVETDHVLVIIAGTKMEPYCAEWGNAIYSYLLKEWQEYTTKEVMPLLRKLLSQGKIIQPRLLNMIPPSRSDGHWIIVDQSPWY